MGSADAEISKQDRPPIRTCQRDEGDSEHVGVRMTPLEKPL